jgi:hypothetical protein
MSVLLIIACLAFAAAAVLKMAEPAHVGPPDATLLLQASVTKTASFNSAGLDLGSGFAPGGAGMPVQANVSYSAGDFTTGDETYTFKLEESADNSSFTACSQVVTAPVTAAAPGGALAVGGFVKQRYVRLVMTAAGTTPSITYQAYLSPYTAR